MNRVIVHTLHNRNKSVPPQRVDRFPFPRSRPVTFPLPSTRKETRWVMAIPDLKNGVLPPHHGSRNGEAFRPTDLPPFPASTLELCQKFSSTPERRDILKGFLLIRERLTELQVVVGFQWVDGHFLEESKKRTRESPEHIRVVTFFTRSPLLTAPNYIRLALPLQRRTETKTTFRVDHTMIPLDWPAPLLIEAPRYRSAELSHSDDSIWKGYIRIALNTLTGEKETSLSAEKIPEACNRISAAVTDDEEITMSGTFGGFHAFSGDFEFLPDVGRLIQGGLNELSNGDMIAKWTQPFFPHRCIAKMTMTTVSSRTGNKKPTYKLVSLKPVEGPAKPSAISKP